MSPETLVKLAKSHEREAAHNRKRGREWESEPSGELRNAAKTLLGFADECAVIAAALRCAAWLAVPGQYVREYEASPARDKWYSALVNGQEVGDGPTALAAVLDAAGVKHG